MTKRETRRAEYKAEIARDLETARHRAIIHRISNAMFDVIHCDSSPDAFDWHKLVSDCRNAHEVDAQLIERSLGKTALWRTEAEWSQANAK